MPRSWRRLLLWRPPTAMAAKARRSASNGQARKPRSRSRRVAAEAGITGPRWIAEAVAISAGGIGAGAGTGNGTGCGGQSRSGSCPQRSRTTATAVEVPAPASVVESRRTGNRRKRERHRSGCHHRISSGSSALLLPRASSKFQRIQGNAPAAEPVVAREESALRSRRICRRSLGTRADSGGGILNGRFARDRIQCAPAASAGSRAAARSRTGRRLAELEADTRIVRQRAHRRASSRGTSRGKNSSGRSASARQS